MFSLALVLEISISLVEPNPFDTRYTSDQYIEELAQSIRSQGQLEPVAVRPHPSLKGHYQLIYGHRRLAAIRSLGVETIRAEIKEVDDISMLQMALVENLQRKDLTDYEKGLLFLTLSDKFGMTYDEIGRIIGKSKQLVSNHVAMTKLFSDKELDEDRSLISSLHQLSEGHARVLSKVPSSQERKQLLMLTLEQNLGVRELKSLVGRPRIFKEENLQETWLNENIRNKSDNRSDLKSRHGRVCVLRTDSVNFLISKLSITPYEAGKEIAIGAGQLLEKQGIDPLDPRNWAKILIEKSRYAGWGKISTTTSSSLVIHEPALNADFTRGYLETLFGIRLRPRRLDKNLQIYEILSRAKEKELVTHKTKPFANIPV